MIYKRIRDLREDRDLTQQEMADQLNITQKTYSRYENGERGIPTEVLRQLALIHETSTDYIVELTDQKEPVGNK